MAEFFAAMPDEAVLAFVLGGVLFLSGALLIALVVRQFLEQRQTTPESLLAPVLAADTLAPDLRVVWVRSMLLEAEAPQSNVDDARRLAREIRRCLVAAQARSVANDDASMERLRELAKSVLGRALELVRAQDADPSEIETEIENLRIELYKKRTAPGDVARGR